jgi:class 3 adenylate cyclase
MDSSRLVVNPRGSTVGISRVGKLIRLVRLIRLFRISKIYKSFSRDNSRTKPELNLDISKNPQKRRNKESKVGRKMSEVATKSVILLVFILLILLPLFNADFWINDPTADLMVCEQYSMLIDTKFETPADIDNLIYNELDGQDDITDQRKIMARFTADTIQDFNTISLGPLVKISFSGKTDYYSTPDFANLREDRMNVDRCTTSKGRKITIYQQNESYHTTESVLGLVRTLYICIVLIGGSYFFSSKTHHLVIAPIERMINRVVALIDKPQVVKEEAFIENEENEFKARVINSDKTDDKKEDETVSNSIQLETKYLENMINKIGVLLGVGLGEAGSELINCYLNKETDILNIANETEAIFGFCDIRNFTDATEVLQEEVMVFVNTIADIVHSIADGALGAANKNVGDAFLIVWRISPEDQYFLGETKKMDLASVWTNLADMALYSILCMHLEIGRAYTLKKFVDNPKMKERVKNFRIRLGFGLHYGWAIEGALGSHYKVDVTYLSPNVNMAARLEGETKKYGVPILLSGEFYDILSPFVKNYCRLIDKVCTGSKPLKLYTPLVSDKNIKYADVLPLDGHILKTKERFYFKKIARAELFNGSLIGSRIFQHSLQIALLTSPVNPLLGKTFKSAFDLFTKGDWKNATELFRAVLKIDKDDGPTKFLLDYIEEEHQTPPPNWIGYRFEDASGH